MEMLSTGYNRMRRSTAGINKRYDEQDYVLVSFPQLNKHSIVPAVSINVDPLDKQNGSIKTFGSRKNLRIISNGPKEILKERASRYAASAGSEEVDLVPDEQENNENQNDSDDRYSPSVMYQTSKENRKQVTASEQTKSQIEINSSKVYDQTTTANDDCFESTTFTTTRTPLSARELNFDRVYSPKTGTKRKHEDNLDESSLSGSDIVTDEESDKHLYVMKKSNELRSLLKKPRYKRRKKQAVVPVSKGEESCSGCKQLDEVVQQLTKRVNKLEKMIPVFKKFRSNAPVTLTNQTNQAEFTNETYTKIEEITGVNPNQIKATPTRPTMVMRELIKKGGHINDKIYLTKHENLFKGQYTTFKVFYYSSLQFVVLEFIQMKCMILDDNLKVVWDEVVGSLSRQHIDEESNKKKKIHTELLSTSTTSSSQLAHKPTIPTEQGTTTSTNIVEKEITTAVSSEPTQSCE
ncbi:unnamed protein product [Adineta steineri]|uniref:Uncharacterized protein n=1 Tax=Adineta steineri TaxID=433720 RepID=A0A815KY46_9BILA|nr:unnamed protein product [Adineta steineri]CAF1612890.1 unnamed protein product [Adineta steineri]